MSNDKYILEQIDENKAKYFHENFHRIKSPREGLVHYQLTDKNGLILMVATFSKFDLSHLRTILPSDLGNDNIIVLSRMVSFEWTPKNTGSQFLSILFSRIKKDFPQVKLVVSYLDPNQNNGALYKASNATLVARERKNVVVKIDNRVVTKRKLISTYGTTDLQELKSIFGSRIKIKRKELKPLEIFVWNTSNYKFGIFDESNSKNAPLLDPSL
jgi:hypothetical protein